MRTRRAYSPPSARRGSRSAGADKFPFMDSRMIFTYAYPNAQCTTPRACRYAYPNAVTRAFRSVVVPGLNDSDDDLAALARVLRSLGVPSIVLLKCASGNAYRDWPQRHWALGICVPPLGIGNMRAAVALWACVHCVIGIRSTQAAIACCAYVCTAPLDVVIICCDHMHRHWAYGKCGSHWAYGKCGSAAAHRAQCMRTSYRPRIGEIQTALCV